MATKAKKKLGRPALGKRHGFRDMGVARKAANDWTVILATNSLYFNITQRMIDAAIPGHPGKCVVALALRALLGNQYPLQVGKVYTKIWDPAAKIEVRFLTPAALSKRLGRFDEKKGWQLPPNIYKLHAIPKAVRNGTTNFLRDLKRLTEKRDGKARVTVKIGGRHTTIIKGSKKTAARKYKPASRTVLRNTRIKWTPPSL